MRSQDGLPLCPPALDVEIPHTFGPASIRHANAAPRNQRFVYAPRWALHELRVLCCDCTMVQRQSDKRLSERIEAQTCYPVPVSVRYPFLLPHAGHCTSSNNPYQMPWQRLHQWPLSTSGGVPSCRASAPMPSSRMPPSVVGGVTREYGKGETDGGSLTRRRSLRRRPGECRNGVSCWQVQPGTGRVHAPLCCDSNGIGRACRAPVGAPAIRPFL